MIENQDQAQPGDVIQPQPNGTALAVRPAEDEIQVMERQTQLVTRRALLLEAQAAELEAAYKIALRMSKTKMVRPEYQWSGDKEDTQPVYNLAVAIQFGGNLNMTPEEAGIRVFTVHGIPSVESKDMVGAVRRWIDMRRQSGLTGMPLDGGDDIWEHEADENHCIWYARRDGREVSSEWTMERAERAGYVQQSRGRNAGPNTKGMYDKVPVEMLRAKCQAEVCRILFSDVLRGVQYSKEELLLEQREVVKPVKSERPAPRGEQALEQHLASRAGFSGTGQQSTAGSAVSDAPGGQDGIIEGEVVPSEPVKEQPPEVLKPIHTLLTEAGITDRDAKLAIFSAIVKRKVDSSKHLSDDEVSDILGTLSRWKVNGHLANACKRLAAGGLLADDTEPPTGEPDPDTGRTGEPGAPATVDELNGLRAIAKRHKINEKQLLDRLTDILGWRVDNLNSLTTDDVTEAIGKIQSAS